MCSTLRSAVLEDRHLWIFLLERDVKHRSPCLPTNLIPLEDAPVGVLRAWVKHAHVLKAGYRNPSLDRTVIRTDTPARVTFVKLVRGRWFFVASSDTTISELSLWEIVSPSYCALRSRVYFPAPVLDGLLDDGGSYIRLAVTVGSWYVVFAFDSEYLNILVFSRPSIRILELAKHDEGEVLLVQLKEIVDVARVLHFDGATIFFACLHGDDTWPTMMNWMSGGMVRLSFSGGGIMGEPYPLTLVSMTML